MSISTGKLREIGVIYSGIYFCQWEEVATDAQLPTELEGSSRLLFQKVLACRNYKVDAIFDDDPVVHRPIKTYLPDVAILSPQ